MRQVVEVSDIALEGQAKAMVSSVSAPTMPPEEELFPGIVVECSLEGIKKGKKRANALFTEGPIEESVRLYSKCLWLVDAGKVSGAPSLLRSSLHSNRAMAYVKLKKWAEAEEDATKSLSANSKT